MKEQEIFQKIEHLESGEALDLSFLKECNFVETMDLSGPRLMAEFDDKFRYLRDDLKIAERDTLKMTLADIYARDGMDEVLDFTILSMPIAGDSVKFNCIFKMTYDLKQPAPSARAFVQKGASAIVSALCPGFKVNAGRFPVIDDYHLLAAERASFMLRQMAREKGAHFYLRRTEACFHRLSDLLQVESPFVYHHDDSRKENQIIQYTAPSCQHILEDRIIRNYQGWNITEGWVTSGVDAPPEIYSSPSKTTLKNINAAPAVVLDFSCTGNGFLMPGMSLDFVWNVQNVDRPIDESLPERAVIWLVAHYYRANKYMCRVKCVRPLSEEKRIVSSMPKQQQIEQLPQAETTQDRPSGSVPVSAVPEVLGALGIQSVTPESVQIAVQSTNTLSVKTDSLFSAYDSITKTSVAVSSAKDILDDFSIQSIPIENISNIVSSVGIDSISNNQLGGLLESLNVEQIEDDLFRSVLGSYGLPDITLPEIDTMKQSLGIQTITPENISSMLSGFDAESLIPENITGMIEDFNIDSIGKDSLQGVLGSVNVFDMPATAASEMFSSAGLKDIATNRIDSTLKTLGVDRFDRNYFDEVLDVFSIENISATAIQNISVNLGIETAIRNITSIVNKIV